MTYAPWLLGGAALFVLYMIHHEVQRAANYLNRLDKRLMDIEHHVLYIQNQSLPNMQISVDSIDANTGSSR